MGKDSGVDLVQMGSSEMLHGEDVIPLLKSWKRFEFPSILEVA